jgi:hypothetical protein
MRSNPKKEIVIFELFLAKYILGNSVGDITRDECLCGELT